MQHVIGKQKLLPNVDWLWLLLRHHPPEPEKLVEECVQLIGKLEQLNLDCEYVLATTLFELYPEGCLFEIHEARTLIPKHIQLIYERFVTISKLKPKRQSNSQMELMRKMMASLSGDVQLLAALLTIRLQQMQQLEGVSPEEQKQFAEETILIYAPLANRLGIFWIKAELEDFSLRYTIPEVYYDLKSKVAKKRNERSKMVEDTTDEIHRLLGKASIPHEVYGRYKRFYSILQKLKKVNNDFSQIHDLFAFRILTPNVQYCYEALSYIHEKWPPIAGRFKDYISKPKTNGYQSLHTTVQIPDGEFIEIQIRTYEMHTIAEFGVAAHWLYKEQGRLPQREEQLYHKYLETQPKEDGQTHFKFPQIELFSNKIYVFTPTDDIIELPKNATPVDFAYAIHSNIGDHMVGAKINGKIARLDDLLKSGDHVEVMTSPKQHPRKEWLKFIQSSKARAKIRYAIREQTRNLLRRKGWEILEKEFKHNELNLNRMVKEGKLEQESKQQKNQSFDHILFSLGEGGVRVNEVVGWFIVPSKEEELQHEPVDPNRPRKTGSKHQNSPITVQGLTHLLSRLAKCCSPQPGDVIQGFITQGQGITIHRKDCPLLETMEPTRLVNVEWNKIEV
ncbi:TGS domain-containing protein [Deltaproteobacteria bacterium TL4]